MSGPLRRFTVVAVACALSVMICTGCGKKADPIRPEIDLPKALAGFQAATQGDAVRLAWSVPEHLEQIRRVKILRSEIVVAGSDCPGCPRTFLEIEDLLLADPRLEREGQTLRYVDRGVRRGSLYTYRIVFCNDSGYCVRMNETAEIKIAAPVP